MESYCVCVCVGGIGGGEGWERGGGEAGQGGQTWAPHKERQLFLPNPLSLVWEVLGFFILKPKDGTLNLH